MTDPALLTRILERLAQCLAIEPHEPLDEHAIARVIRANNLEAVVFGRWPTHEGRGYTFSQAFALAFGKTLEGKPLKNKGKTA